MGIVRRWLLAVGRAALIVMIACRPESPKPALDRGAFEREIAAYRNSRVERLTRPEGWLSVVALLPLQEGKNDVELPSTPPKHARITLQQGRVTLDPDSTFTIDNKPVAAPVQLRNDTDDAG